MIRKICVVLQNISRDIDWNNSYCKENEFVSKSSFVFENNTLYFINILVNTIKRIEKIIIENPGRNIIFKVRNRFIKFLLRSNQLEKLTNVENTVAVYTYSSEIKNFEIITIELDLDDYMYLLINILPKPLSRLIYKAFYFIKFTIVGLTGYIINLIVLYLSTSYYSSIANYEYAVFYGTITSFETSLTWNFLLHEYWTFRDRGLKHSFIKIVERWFKFHISSAGSFISQLFFTTLLSGYLKQPLYLSLTIGVLTGLLINYFFSSRITWRR